jgi:hypothetical protein
MPLELQAVSPSGAGRKTNYKSWNFHSDSSRYSFYCCFSQERYITIDVDGEEYRVFYLENGTGQPIVCQYTAGCHNHQWQGVLEDEEFTKNYRIIAYDLYDAAGWAVSFSLDTYRRECLLNGWDDIDITLKSSEKLSDYESKLPIYYRVHLE